MSDLKILSPEREQAIRDWLERQCFNSSEGLTAARDLMEELDGERQRGAENSRAALQYAEELDVAERKIRDLQAIIGRQEEEIDKYKFALRELALEGADYHAALSQVIATSERFANGWEISDTLYRKVIDVLRKWASDE